jgi:tripartite motif-containing protein 71
MGRRRFGICPQQDRDEEITGAGTFSMTAGSRMSGTRRASLAMLAGLVAVCASVVQGHATVSTPTPTGNFAGGRVTSADGVLIKGSTAISAADANFTTSDVGFGILAQGIPAGATITGVTSSTQATISVAATKKTSTAVFAIEGANAALYGWGDATEPDGSILVGDYWNNRIVHYNDDGTEATPFVFTQSKVGFGTDTNQAPFGICVDNSGGPFQGYVYMTEGSLYNVVQYDPNGNWVTSWGTTNAAHTVAFDYPSQCVVNPTNGLVYISNQFGKSIVVLNPSTNVATFVSPPSPNTFIQPRGLAFDGLGNIWIADQGHHRIDIYSPSCLQNPWPTGTTCAKPIKEITPPGGVTTTFDMRGLAIDITAPATTLTPTAVPLMFVTNGQNCLVQEFDADPTSNYKNVAFLTNFNNANLADGSDCGTPGQLAADGQFEDGARGLAIDGNHDVWAGDLGDFRTQVFDENGNWLNNVPGYWPGDNGGTSPPSVPAGGGFNGPRGVAFDGAGNMYVTDMYNERIEEFSPTVSGGWTLDTAQNSGSVTPGAWGMRGDGPGQMNYPRLLCWDPLTVTANGDGALIEANTDSDMIVAWNTNRNGNPPTVVWSTPTAPNTFNLADPYGVACDTDPTSPGYGLIYIANSNGKDIVVLNPDGSAASYMGGTTNTMGVGVLNGFSRGITVDTDGSVWVDTGTASKVYHFASFASGGALLSTFTASSGGSTACNPFGMAATTDYLYVTCPSANNVVYYAKNGTQPPTFVAAFGSYNVFGLVGTMRTPQGLAIGPNGDLYVVEENNDRVSEWQVPQ